ncbi:MAG: Hsp20/alpha crystallin family protein [Clostridia bacterium]|jgi:HSP20 family molecular chaperone IbpA|nr:Hsp20/alpha crystallin family protein [Clostridia bacterium]MBR5380931.1 Hsp20/alpha crystallin family protein [Clostridia bacterium]
MLMRSFFNDDLFDGFFEDFARPANQTRYTRQLMGTDIRETETGYELDIELPGYKKEDVQAELKDGYLTVSASAKTEDDKGEKGRYLRRERYWGSCSRSFYVGKDVKQEDIKARFEDGILKISFPKPELIAPKEENKFISIEG